MARYIDADTLLNALKKERKNGNFVFTSKWIKEIVENLPTADVVPRSEVARAIFEEIERVAMSKIDENAPISTLDDTVYIQAIDEVRQKYTEGEK